ncbi:hypothetical protein [Microvirga massiliensis]|uniref:hypothetical protein n=1 Tax=Microvirga massiliensis TaxID=1033741 RepID=UPI00062B675E|nr:hypothetical protein [Microvirga massiliensis]
MKKALVTACLLVLMSAHAQAGRGAEQILQELRVDALRGYTTCSVIATTIGRKSDTLSVKAFAKEVQKLSGCISGMVTKVKSGVLRLRSHVAGQPHAEALLDDFTASFLALSTAIQAHPGFSDAPGTQVIVAKLDRFRTDLSP